MTEGILGPTSSEFRGAAARTGREQRRGGAAMNRDAVQDTARTLPIDVQIRLAKQLDRLDAQLETLAAMGPGVDRISAESAIYRACGLGAEIFVTASRGGGSSAAMWWAATWREIKAHAVRLLGPDSLVMVSPPP